MQLDMKTSLDAMHSGVNDGGIPGSVLILSGVLGDTRRYRAAHLAEQFRLLGMEPVYEHVWRFSLSLLEKTKFSYAFLHRVTADSFTKRIVAELKRQGTIILYDTDDLVFDPRVFSHINAPDFSDPIRARLYQQNMNHQREMLLSCSGATVSTNYLAEKVKELGVLARVHKNAFSLDMFYHSEQAYQNRRKDPNQVVIGYASGTPTHNRDFEMIKPALQAVLERFPHVELRIAGLLEIGEGWGRCAGRIRRLPFVPWLQLPEVLAQFDINLAPLVADNPFSQSKSEIKYIEAGLVRVPTIASATDAFCASIKSGENGFLATDPVEWEAALSQLVINEPLRVSMGINAYQQVLMKYHPSTRAEELAEMLSDFSVHFLNQPFQFNKDQCKKAISSNLQKYSGHSGPVAGDDKAPSIIQRILYSLRYRGIKTLIAETWIFFRRLFSPLIPFKKL